MTTIFILNTATGALAGVVGNLKNYELQADHIAVKTPADMINLSNAQLTTIYNAITGESKAQFKTAKTESTVKVFKAMEAADLTKLVKLDKKETTKVQAAADGERKPRDSKLQRMAACFREQDSDGNYKHWTIKELMDRCGKGPDDPMTDKIAHQYISILRAKNDRFVMDITKHKDGDKVTFQYTPKNVQPAPQVAATV